MRTPKADELATLHIFIRKSGKLMGRLDKFTDSRELARMPVDVTQDIRKLRQEVWIFLRTAQNLYEETLCRGSSIKTKTGRDRI